MNGFFRVSPLTRQRWQQFWRNRRARISLLLLAGVYIVSLGAELISNDRPLYLRVDGRRYFPFLRYVSQHDVLADGIATAPDWRLLREHPVFTSNSNNRLVMAPIPFGPHQVENATALEAYRRATLTIKPDTPIARINLAPDYTITRPLGLETFIAYKGQTLPTPEGQTLSLKELWQIPAELENAISLRFNNQDCDSFRFILTPASKGQTLSYHKGQTLPDPKGQTPDHKGQTLPGSKGQTLPGPKGQTLPGPKGQTPDHKGQAFAVGAVEVSLAAFKTRAAPPTTVRMTLRETDATLLKPLSLRLRRADDAWVPVGKAWKRLKVGDNGFLQSKSAGSPSSIEELSFKMNDAGRFIDHRVIVPDNMTLDFRPDAIAWPHRPVPDHWMGIDSAGRDVLARILYGTRIALSFGILLVVWSTLLGLVVGAIQGYFGGRIDLATQRFIEVWSALPFLYVMILLGSVLGRSFGLLLLCYGLFNWIGLSYYMRAEFLRLRQHAFVDAARCQGLGATRIIWRHILPNALTPLITLLPFSLVGAIGSLTALDFLGFGLPPLTPSWGELMLQAQQNRSAWWLSLYPSLVLFSVMLITVFIGEGLRDAFDPKPQARYR